MRPLVTKYAWVSTLVVLILSGFSISSRASHITASPDTVRMTSPNVYYISLSDGRDTNSTPKTPLTYAHLSISGSADWTMFSDSSISFFGRAYAIVEYKPMSSSPSTAVLSIAGDSNTAIVILIGTPANHTNLSVRGTSFLHQRPGHDTCHEVMFLNLNSFSVSVNTVTVTSSGSQYTLANIPSLSHTIAAHDTMRFDVCFRDSVVSDTDEYNATVNVAYTYTGGSDVATATIHGSIDPYDTTCININATAVGTTAPGSSVSRTFTLTNHTNSSVTIDSATILGGSPGGAFSITSPSFPVTVSAKSTVALTVQFAPPSSTTEGNYYNVFAFWDRGTSNDALPCGSMNVAFTGTVQVPVSDTTYLDVPADSSSTISFTTTAPVSRHAFIVHNASSSRILLASLAITNTDSIASFDPYGSVVYVHDTLAVSANSHMVVMKLDVPDTGSYNVGLLLNYVNALLSQSYTVKVHRIPTGAAAVHASSVAPSAFTLNSNPARGQVVITLPSASNATVEIYDVLGNVILTKQASGRFVWDGTSTGDAMAATGSYIVRVIERNTDGRISSSAKRLVFVR